MKQSISCFLWITAFVVFAAMAHGSELDRILQRENDDNNVKLKPAPIVDDLTFLRRVTMDLIGRIPTIQEIRQFQSWPATERRQRIVDELLNHSRFADRWTTFYADMLRVRSNAEGGSALIAYLHRSIEDDVPYDELARRLIVTNGKAGRTPEVGFVLGDNADPMALASATAQVFMGVRMGCAQCHDHPFDKWTREDFYGLAAYYGMTRRVTSNLTNVVYTTEAKQTTVLWPPEGVGDDDKRNAMAPRFPIELSTGDGPLKHITRLNEHRARLALAKSNNSNKGDDLDDLLAKTDEKIKQRVGAKPADASGVNTDAKRDLRKINIKAGLYGHSELRNQLAEFITSPRNRYFSRAFVNRVWAELVGRGFVEPVDDFREDNPASHNATLDYLADEFVAGGYDLKNLVSMIVTSQSYQHSHVTGDDEQLQMQMEESFLATPMRRVLSEALYDSIVAAGHLFDVKHAPGTNERVYYETVRVRVNEPKGTKSSDTKPATLLVQGGQKMAAMEKMRPNSGYEIETAIELDFDAVLKESEDDVAVDQMKVMSKEELEAMRMQEQNRMPRGKYVEKQVERVVDDNPKFASSFRMASPAPPAHFLRVFGQSSRSQLGEARDPSPSMRQALLMLNGRLTNEASRVGEFEPIHELLVGEKADLNKAIQFAYIEILTREPSTEELTEGREIVGDAASDLDGIADLRWVLLNCNEFRYLR